MVVRRIPGAPEEADETTTTTTTVSSVNGGGELEQHPLEGNHVVSVTEEPAIHSISTTDEMISSEEDNKSGTATNSRAAVATATPVEASPVTPQGEVELERIAQVVPSPAATPMGEMVAPEETAAVLSVPTNIPPLPEFATIIPDIPSLSNPSADSHTADLTEEPLLSEQAPPVVVAAAAAGAVVAPVEAPQEVAPTPSTTTPRPSCDILSLPLDSIHHVASFLTPKDWASMGQTSDNSRRLYREIMRRVRLHGFKCATEVVTAWKLGEHADAKELAALYCRAGVPIYPRSLGYSYHTLVWRMKIEAKVMHEQHQRQQQQQQQQQQQGTAVTSTATTTEGEGVLATRLPIDTFYAERLDFRASQGYSPEVTYVEEKSLFWMDKELAKQSQLGSPMRNSFRRALTDTLARPPTNLDGSGSGGSIPADLSSEAGEEWPRISVKMHQHLLDQHMMGKFCVDDQEETMVTAPVSLSADFYHPRRTQPLPPPPPLPVMMDATVISSTATSPTNSAIIAADFVEPPTAADLLVHQLERAVDDVVVGVHDLVIHEDLVVEGGGFLHPEGGDALPLRLPPPPVRLSAILKSTEVSVYTAHLEGGSKSGDRTADELNGLKRHLRSRFATYMRRLEGFAAHNDNSGFEECVMDFWDEFFPQTANIQYHDRHTAVPRISCLHKFLTRPCPKPIGTVQCEIERIKTNNKGKGVNMGRFFPSYEYRLFIRHQPPNVSSVDGFPTTPVEEDSSFVRRDTVLLVTKNRGRKHAEASSFGNAKKGANNYFIYMPQQMDVDAHFNQMNESEEQAKMVPNGASHDPVLVSNEAGSVLMGRLQSNFLGTDFQIFTPTFKKKRKMAGDCSSSVAAPRSVSSPSDDEGYDSGVSSDNASSSRRSRFGRFLRTNSYSDQFTESQTRRRARSAPRSGPVSDLTSRSRPNRRAIANENQPHQPYMGEEEEGVITYTANLLGSRPRIMDVCIPKVTSEGVGVEWKRYLDGMGDSGDDSGMLTCFRQLQQRLGNLDPQQPRRQDDTENSNILMEDDVSSNQEPGEEDFGLLALQNRPPWWNVELGSFVLNFGGRVSVASVKNFQLCDRNDQDNIMLQFGRIAGRHSFTMDFSYPLTAVQAFSIAISSLQSKICIG